MADRRGSRDTRAMSWSRICALSPSRSAGRVRRRLSPWSLTTSTRYTIDSSASAAMRRGTMVCCHESSRAAMMTGFGVPE